MEKKDISLSKLEPNKFNPNVMTKEEFDVLCLDMKTTGPKHALKINDILVSPKTVFYNDPNAEPGVYVIIDGEHRFNAAKTLGWQTIPCEIQNITEDLARVINYRRNKERGHPDPLKEAALFKWEEDRGKTHDQIGRAYMIDRTTVTKRISLLNITDETWKLLDEVPHGTIKVSHLEPVATLKPELQKEVAERVVSGAQYGHTMSVSAVERISKAVKKEDQDRRKLEAAVKKSKFPKCPDCKNPATRIHWEGLPWVRCQNGHSWNLETGKIYGFRTTTAKADTKAEKPKPPQTVRSFTTVKEYRDAIEEIIVKAVVPQFTEITNISIRGTLEGAESDFHVRLADKRIYFSFSIGSSGHSVSMEPHDYRSGEKTKVFNIWPAPQSEKDVKKINDFLKSLKEKTLLQKKSEK